MAQMKLSGVIVRSAVSRPATRLYPFEKREDFAGTRGKVVMNPEECNFCTLCQMKCPAGAILVNREQKTWQIDRFRCILCGACVGACMRKVPKFETAYTQPSALRVVETYRQEPKFEPWLEKLLATLEETAEELASKQ
jgi:ech hydrogenase subunit F